MTLATRCTEFDRKATPSVVEKPDNRYRMCGTTHRPQSLMARLNSPETGMPKELNVRLKSAAHLRHGCKENETKSEKSEIPSQRNPERGLFDNGSGKAGEQRRATHLHEMVFYPAQLRLEKRHVPVRIERDAVQSRDPPRLGLDLVLVPGRATATGGDWSTLDVDVDLEGHLRLEEVCPSTGAFEAVVEDDDLISQPKRGVGSESAKRIVSRGDRFLGGASSEREAKGEQRTGPLPAP